MLVYRIEHKETGTGPFRSEGMDNVASLWGQAYWDASDSMHPIPLDDGLKDFVGTHVFGLPTFDMVFHWFERIWNRLRFRDFVLRVYDVNESDSMVGKSGTQVAFRKDRATLVEEMTL